MSLSEPSRLEDLHWLEGVWVEQKEGKVTEEHWTAPGGGMILGMNRTVRASGRAEFEALRIVQVGTEIRYIAQPGGGKPIEFRLTKSASDRVRFENPDHDFPTEIEYVRQGADTLIATVSGVIDGAGRSMSWTFSRRNR
jgi:hypothetical protein